MKTPSLLTTRLLPPWLVVLMFAVASIADDTSPVPAWRQGHSTWNGSGYESVEPAAVSGSPTPAGYVLPIVPGTSSAPAADSTILEAAKANPSVQVVTEHEPPTFVDVAAIRQVDAQQGVPATEPWLNPPAVDDVPGAIGQQIGSGVTLEAPPLQEETASWYEIPWRWITKGWENHAEFGLDGSDGNADTLAIQTGLEMKRKTDAYTFAIDFDYRQASNRSVITEDNARLNLDYDRLVGESQWTMFGKLGLEYDEFKAFDLRLNLNGGLGYYWIRNDRTTFVTRFGSGASREFGAPLDEWTPEAVFGIEAEHQLNSRNKLKGKVDYFPAWEDFSDYRLVADLGWEILLNDSENFSLKLAVTDRYDSTPQGAEPNDIYYSALLLYKF